MAKGKVFRIELRSAYAEWWRYNVFIAVACFDAGGNVSDYLTLSDKVYEPGDGTESRQAPADYDPSRPLSVETVRCDHADVYVYVIANTFPSSAVIGASPPFEIEVLVRSDGSKPETHIRKVNQWGGASVKLTVL